jgi:hypothetical protein
LENNKQSISNKNFGKKKRPLFSIWNLKINVFYDSS